MGGSIELESSPDRTIFTLVLPEAEAVPPTAAPELEPAPA
jgi:nitrogen-specific signal transduction histidine kinase